MRKQRKLPTTEDPMTKDIEEGETQKVDIMKLIVDQNIQIKQMETDLEKLIKEKEDSVNMAIVPLDDVPLSQLPSTGAATAPPTSTQKPSVEQVTQTLQNMSLQSKEIDTL